MIHHVALEVGPADMAAESDFWLAVGFEPVSPAEALGEGFSWFERDGSQIHLMSTGVPSAPPERGHVAVVASDFGAALERLESGGFTVNKSRMLWGARRAKAKSPAGHVVELMEFPPSPAMVGP
ncbi:MAG TPA: VOC family protein [Solirubrobacterales bacterium]|nr:VOC family protein [Solirubrobacterales bacterium]